MSLSNNRTTPSRPQGTPSKDSRRHRSNSVSLQQQQFPVPLSVQIYNLFPGTFLIRSSEEPTTRNARLDYSTNLLRPVQAELVDVPRQKSGENNDNKAPTVLYTFPQDDMSRCSTSPCWTHLPETIDWEDLDRAKYERIHMRFRLAEAPPSRDDEEGLGPYFLQIPLHPSKLVPLEREPPPNRPINTVLVHFSDESIRITPQVFEQLKHESLAVADEQLLRFEEDAFQALDSVVPSSPPANLLDAAEEMENSGSALAIHATSTEVSVEVLPSPGSAEQRLAEELSHLETESSARIAELLRERDAWRDRVQAEKEAVEAAKVAWQIDRAFVRVALDTLRTKEEQILQIRRATCDEELGCLKLEWHLEAQRIRLVKELRQFYPVASVEGPPKIWKIRGLPLPKDIFSIPEDDLSASLGFLCHAVSLLSRYLCVPLRYRLYCNSSRSAVQNDMGTVFPLFQARPVEREQVEYGVVLLERNIECIGSSRGIQWVEEGSSLHILEKVNRIYETVIEDM